MGVKCCKPEVSPVQTHNSPEQEVLSVEFALCRYLNAVVRLRSCERDITVAQWKVSQALCDSLYNHGCIPLRRIYIGSYYEGVPLEVCSDNNMFLLNASFPIVLPDPKYRPPEVTTIGERHSTYVIPEANEENPGYTRLIIPAELTTKLDLLIQTTACVYDSRPHLSGHLFKTRVSSRDLRQSGGRNRKELYDELHALVCPGWPKVAEEWMTRTRHRGWPAQSHIKKVESGGCHLQPSGHPRCKDRDLQWRWMFSLGERTLIHGLTDTQGAALYLVKALTRRGTPTPPSYHVKTACFWTFERYGEGTRNITIIDLVYKILETLYQFYVDWNLPHYFIPRQNLISHMSQYKCRKLAKRIEELVRQYKANILTCLSTDTQNPYYINSIREDIGLDSRPQHKLRDHVTLLRRVRMSENNVQSVMRVVRLIQEGTPDYLTVRRIHVLDAMENVKVDILNAVKQVIKYHRRSTTHAQENGAPGTLPVRSSSVRMRSSRQKLTSSRVRNDGGRMFDKILQDFEAIMAETDGVIAQELGREELEAFRGFVTGGLAEAYRHLSLEATVGNTGGDGRGEVGGSAGGDTKQVCRRKAEECLERTMLLRYKDGRDVLELDGHFTAAVYYYQNCDYGRVVSLLGEIHPGPGEEGFVPALEGSVYPLTIHPGDRDVVREVGMQGEGCWRGDPEFHSCITRRQDNLMINPAAFAYYMYIRALRHLGNENDDVIERRVSEVRTSRSSKVRSSIGKLSLSSIPSQDDDVSFVDKMQNATYSYGTEATNLLLRILCE